MVSPAIPVDFARALEYLTGHADLERGDRLPSELNLERTRVLLAGLGRPEQRYRSILIAGTKGKGSTAAMIERGLRAAGFRTGLYTQPHLHTIRERVRVNGELISPQAFADGIGRVREVAEHGGPSTGRFTAYELMTAQALERFAAAEVDVAVLEVGLGGRLDATNVVEADVSVLASISLDHMQILGDTIEQIAREKADIIKVGRPVASAPQLPEAMAVIWETAAARHAPLRIVDGSGAAWEPTAEGWDLLLEGERIADLRPSLAGGFQRINAALAATALSAFGKGLSERPISLNAIRAGIEAAEWPGRFEIASRAPLTILDGAHNVESAQRLREAIEEEFPGKQPIYVLGIARDKDLAGIVDALCRPPAPGITACPTLVVATQSENPRAAAPGEIKRLTEQHGIAATSADSVRHALALAGAAAGPDQVIVATGSLHVVAEAREAMGLAEPSGEDVFNPWATR